MIQTYATFPGVPIFIADPSVSLVPEPLSMSLLELGGIALLARRWRASCWAEQKENQTPGDVRPK